MGGQNNSQEGGRHRDNDNMVKNVKKNPMQATVGDKELNKETLQNNNRDGE